MDEFLINQKSIYKRKGYFHLKSHDENTVQGASMLSNTEFLLLIIVKGGSTQQFRYSENISIKRGGTVLSRRRRLGLEASLAVR